MGGILGSLITGESYYLDKALDEVDRVPVTLVTVSAHSSRYVVYEDAQALENGRPDSAGEAEYFISMDVGQSRRLYSDYFRRGATNVALILSPEEIEGLFTLLQDSTAYADGLARHISLRFGSTSLSFRDIRGKEMVLIETEKDYYLIPRVMFKTLVSAARVRIRYMKRRHSTGEEDVKPQSDK